MGLSDPQGQHCGLWDVLLATPTNIRITWPAESSYPTLRVCYLALLYVQISFPISLVICTRVTSVSCHLTNAFNNSFMLLHTELLCCSSLYLEKNDEDEDMVPAPRRL